MTITLIEIDSNVQGESSTSLSISTGDKNIVLSESQPFVKGLEITIKYDDSNYMSGTIRKVSGLTISVNITSTTGSGTHTSWVLNSNRTLYFGTKSYISKSTDNPSNQEYVGDIRDAGAIEQYMYSVATTFGKSRMSSGDIVINNKNGNWDFVRKLGFKKASLKIKQVENEKSSLPLENIFAGTVLYPEVSFDKIIFSISDRLKDLDIQAQESLFDGSNSGSTGIEGTENDIKGSTKPFIYGGPSFNILPPLLNSSSLIYGVNFDFDGDTDSISSINEIRDNGVILTIDNLVGSSGDVSDLATLQSSTITPGRYITCLSEGLFRLGSNPSGIITCDVTESNSTPGDIVKSLLERVGLTSSDYIDSDFVSLNSILPYNIEIYVDSDDSVIDVCNELLSDLGAFIFTNSENKISVGYLKNPDNFQSVKTFDDYSVIDFSTIRSRDEGDGVPPKQIKLFYKKNYKQFSDSDFAGSVTPENRELYINEFKINESNINSNIDLKHHNAPIFNLYSHITNLTDSNTELSRQVTLRQKERNFYSFKTYDDEVLNIGDIIEIKNSKRFDLSSGKNVIILGKEIEFSKSLVTYIVWG